MFKLYSTLKPIPPQIRAVKKIVKNIKEGVKGQVLLGVTGCGKTFVMAQVIEKIQKPVLVISHNKTLAAQLYQEFKEFFPENAVHYFVSYYDYYQPEAYIPQTDTYIEKDAKINEVIDRLRHESVQSLSTRNDVIVIASVSCIYNIGSPENYQKISLLLKKGQKMERKNLFLNLVHLQYQRNEIDFLPGTFRTRENVIEIFSPTGKEIIKIEISGNRIENISRINLDYSRNIRDNSEKIREIQLFPSKFWVSPREKLSFSLENIRLEMQERLKELKRQKKFFEAERLEKKTNYDIGMIEEIGWCHGIENYSRHLEFRHPGDPPSTLLDYYNRFSNIPQMRLNESRITNSAFKNNSISFGENSRDYLVFIDESHMTIPQLGAMYEGDKQRKKTLIEYGFRLPSALDNRPLKFEEFEKTAKQVVYVSATPGPYEMSSMTLQGVVNDNKSQKSKMLTEILIRPTGLLDPKIEIKPTENQIDDLIKEIKGAIENKERVLITTLTKRLAEDLADYLEEKGFKVNYLHSEIKTLERPSILRDLRLGKYDVLVGINLLREGLDLPEVALVGILDADKEGFLRNETTLIQTMGRAARHQNGRIIMYADKITNSMKKAIEETERRRKVQEDYNKKYGIVPKPIVKKIREWEFSKKEESKDILEIAKTKDLKILEKEMQKAAKNLDFERAAKIRDEIRKIEKFKRIKKSIEKKNDKNLK